SPALKSSNDLADTVAIVPRVLRGVLQRLFGELRLAVERTHAGVDLAVAIRAEHHAFRELGDDPGPTPHDAVLADTECLFARVSVMELEQHGRGRSTAGSAGAALECDRTGLAFEPFTRRRLITQRRLLLEMSTSMAVRTQQIAFLRLRDEAVPGPTEAPDAEIFRRCVAVMELKSRGRGAVSTSDAGTTELLDQPQLVRAALLLLIAIRLRVPALSAQFGKRLRTDIPWWR